MCTGKGALCLVRAAGPLLQVDGNGTVRGRLHRPRPSDQLRPGARWRQPQPLLLHGPHPKVRPSMPACVRDTEESDLNERRASARTTAEQLIASLN